MATEPDIPQTTAPGVRVDGVGCMAIVGMILCGTIFLAPLGIIIIAISLIFFIINYLKEKAQTQAIGPCPACEAPLIWRGARDRVRCHGCQAVLKIDDGKFTLVPTPETTAETRPDQPSEPI